MLSASVPASSSENGAMSTASDMVIAGGNWSSVNDPRIDWLPITITRSPWMISVAARMACSSSSRRMAVPYPRTDRLSVAAPLSLALSQQRRYFFNELVRHRRPQGELQCALGRPEWGDFPLEVLVADGQWKTEIWRFHAAKYTTQWPSRVIVGIP